MLENRIHYFFCLSSFFHVSFIFSFSLSLFPPPSVPEKRLPGKLPDETTEVLARFVKLSHVGGRADWAMEGRLWV